MSRRRRSALEVAAIPERLMTVRRALEHHATSRALGAAAVLGVAALAYTLSAESPSAGSPSAPIAGSPLASSGTVSVTVKKMSVLDEPGLDNAVVVDPAGLRFIQGASIGGAQGASRAIYEWLRKEPGAGFAFPAEVKKKVTDVTMAAFHAYGTPSSAKHVIHVASPDLRTVKTLDEALAWLTKAYKNVFAEFERQSGRTLRLLPLSSGEFVGKFEKNIHELTARAFYAAGGAEIDNLVLCTFTSDPAPYITALAKFGPGLAPGLDPRLAPGLAPQGQTFREALDVLTSAYKAAISAGRSLPSWDQVGGLAYAKPEFTPDLEARAMNDADAGANSRAVTYGRDLVLPVRRPSPNLAVAKNELGDAVAVCERYAQNKKVGVMVAGNSGRPAGNVGNDDEVAGDQVHEGHKTQEESVVSSWMLGECMTCDAMGALFRRTIAARWGMKTINATDHETIQGVDYTKASPEDYADAWVVRDATMLVPKTGAETKATLVFVSGPNVGNGGTDTGSMQRTRNGEMARNYALFLEGVKCAVRAGLDAMIVEGVDVALVARISCGIYAGTQGSDFRTQINADFLGLVNEILGEPLGPSKRGNYFQSVVVPMITTVATTRFV